MSLAPIKDVAPSQDAIATREAAILAPYAMHSAESAGRKHAEPQHPYRGPFQRDRDRIVHSAAYRRLSAKTQVFTGEHGDYHRTRLTHTLEVASVARTLGRALRLNEDLVEALALAHDLGHPPFGHAGEDTLNACLASVGGFNHNQHGLTVVEELEQRYPEFPGLNLSHEVLEGQTSRIDKSAGLGQPLLEVQVVEAADSVAYDTHDADDALELGLLTLDELLETSLWRQAALRVRQRWTDLSGKELERALIHELIDWQVSDLLSGATRRLAELEIDSVQAVRAAPCIIRPSSELADEKLTLERFLQERVYRHAQVLHMRIEAQAYLEQLFHYFMRHEEALPTAFRKRASMVGLTRAVGDYVAGMTDRYAFQQYGRLIAAAR